MPEKPVPPSHCTCMAASWASAMVQTGSCLSTCFGILVEAVTPLLDISISVGLGSNGQQQQNLGPKNVHVAFLISVNLATCSIEIAFIYKATSQMPA